MASGSGVQGDYCMGNRAETDLYGPSPDGKCSKCGKTDKKGVRSRDQDKLYKISASHKNVVYTISFAGAGISILNLSSLQSKPPVPNSTEGNDYSPAYETGPSPIILHLTFK